jgi:two-component system, NtrC family, response regulator GlrR
MTSHHPLASLAQTAGAEPWRQPSAVPATALTVRPARILVVDDDDLVLTLISRLLSTAGYEVNTALDGEAALAVCEQFKPDLILSDVNMEPLDGLGLLTQVQQRWPGLSIILHTARWSAPMAAQAIEDGAFAFLEKPMGRLALFDQVARALDASTFSFA